MIIRPSIDGKARADIAAMAQYKQDKIKVFTSLPLVSDLQDGEIAFYYEVELQNLSKYPDATSIIYTGSTPKYPDDPNDGDPAFAFDESLDTVYSCFVGDSWVKVEFNEPKIVKQLVMFGIDSSTTLQALKFQASNNDTDWVDLIQSILSRDDTIQYFDIDNINAYKYYRILEVSNHGNSDNTKYVDIRLMG